MRWESDSSRFTFLYNQRGRQVLRIVAVDARRSPLVARRSTLVARRSPLVARRSPLVARRTTQFL